MKLMSSLHAPRRRAPYSSPSRRLQRFNLDCESLEVRQLLSTATTTPNLSQITALPSIEMTPMSGPGSTALTPQQIQGAYGIDKIALSGGIKGNGAGQTIAIVDAYNDPNITSDLTAFDNQFGLAAPPSFKVDNLGATTTDAGWALETALDVEWAHAIAPGANIVLVEASGASMSSLYNAVTTASSLAGVSVVSMSWGTNEYYGEWNNNSVFVTPAGHSNVTFIAASGDQGAWSGPSYPAVSQNVLAVGGSTLTVGSGNTYGSETGWSGSTGGFSGLDNGFQYGLSIPSYQVSTLTASGLNYGLRTTPDVSFNADPNSGVAVYDSVNYSGQSGWFTVGGTSAAAPAWAGLVAITDQGLAQASKGTLTNNQLQTQLYSLPSAAFHDITTGFNGYSATPGYDLVTGLGTPVANVLVPDLLAANGVTIKAPTTTASTSTSASTTTSAHARASLQVVVSSSPTTGASGNVGGSSTSSGSATAAGSVGILTASSTSAAQSVGVLSFSSIASMSTVGSSSPAQAMSATSATTAAPAVSLGQGLSPSLTPSPWISGSESSVATPLDAVEFGQPDRIPAPEAKKPDVPPADDGTPAQPLTPNPPVDAPSKDILDEAMSQLAEGLLAGRIESTANEADGSSPDEAPGAGPAFVGAFAVVIGGYRLASRHSESRSKRRTTFPFPSR